MRYPRERRYVIYTPPYDRNIGGIVALHTLYESLRATGARAAIWYDWMQPSRRDSPPWGYLMRVLRTLRSHYRALRGDVPLDNGPIRATALDVRSAIVIYPEIVDGNPLNARRVVRWFLNKPGVITGRVTFGPGELYFYYQQVFDDPAINPNPDNQLLQVALLDSIYTRRNFGVRHGTCYILRKGRDRVLDPSVLDGPVLDGLSHEETAEAFNRYEYCVSYDAYTMYSYYATLCGCKSIVVPQPGVSKQVWQPNEQLAYGIAYGMEDLPHAVATAGKMEHHLRELKQKNLDAVSIFRTKCREFFA